MTPLARKLLIGSLALMIVGLLFLVGILPAGGRAVGLLVLFPVGAVFFGLFLIIRVLGNEARHYDQEHAASMALADRQASSHTRVSD
jgi:hypothetical protein